MKRVLDIARIQLTNWPTMLAYPLGLLASLVVLGLVVDVSNGETAVDHQIFVLPSVYLVVGSTQLQTMTQVFPFAVGLGVTRRAFATATAVVVAGYALLFGLALLGFQQIERATGGWGRHAQIFGLDYLRQDNPVAQWLVCTVPFLAVSTAAVFAGVVFQRWRLTGIYLLATGVVTVLAGIGALATWRGWWPAVGGRHVLHRPVDGHARRRLPVCDRPGPGLRRLARDPPREVVAQRLPNRPFLLSGWESSVPPVAVSPLPLEMPCARTYAVC